jgi:hypothetical protein
MNLRKIQPSESLTDKLLHAAEYERGITDHLIRGLVERLPKPDSIWPLSLTLSTRQEMGSVARSVSLNRLLTTHLERFPAQPILRCYKVESPSFSCGTKLVGMHSRKMLSRKTRGVDGRSLERAFASPNCQYSDTQENPHRHYIASERRISVRGGVVPFFCRGKLVTCLIV